MKVCPGAEMIRGKLLQIKNDLHFYGEAKNITS